MSLRSLGQLRIRGSFERLSAYRSVDDSDSVREEAMEKFEYQKQGYLYMKKLRKDALHRGGFMRPHWFVIKDSFLIWYKTKPGVPFDINPVGCLPLGSCLMYGPWQDEKAGGCIFEIASKGLNGHSLVLRTDESDTEGVVAEGWIKLLEESKVATWENSVYGDHQLVQLESRTRQKDKVNERVLEELNENAKAAAIAANQKLMLMEKKLEEDRRLRTKLRRLKQERKEMNAQLDSLKKQLNGQGVEEDSVQTKANEDVLRAMDFVVGEITKLSPRLRQQVLTSFVVLKDFIDDHTEPEESIGTDSVV